MITDTILVLDLENGLGPCPGLDAYATAKYNTIGAGNPFHRANPALGPNNVPFVSWDKHGQNQSFHGSVCVFAFSGGNICSPATLLAASMAAKPRAKFSSDRP